MDVTTQGRTLRAFSTVVAEVKLIPFRPDPWAAVTGLEGGPQVPKFREYATREMAEGMVERWVRRRFRVPQQDELV
jgi:hypothetical protein